MPGTPFSQGGCDGSPRDAARTGDLAQSRQVEPHDAAEEVRVLHKPLERLSRRSTTRAFDGIPR
jgi:hypothetical protein